MTSTKFLRNTALVGVALCAAASAGFASSHREAPGTAAQPKIDGTDFYMFRSFEPGRADYVTFIANYQPIQSPYGGPNYFTMDDNALYEIHIDNNGDAIEDISFQFDFTNALISGGTGIALDIDGTSVEIPLRALPTDSPTVNETESYAIEMVTGDRRSGTRASVTHSGGATFTKPIDNIGTKTINNYQAYADQFIYDVTIPGCAVQGKAFVGQRHEAFAVNLGRVFDSVNMNPFFTGNLDSNNDLLDANVTSIALEVPIACVIGAGNNGVIGAWTTASLPQGQLEIATPSYGKTTKYGGAWVQQSRLSNPLVNEVVIGLKDKDLFNAVEPTADGAVATYVTNPTLPAILNILFGGSGSSNIAPTNFPRTDLVAAFLTGFPGFNQQSTVTGSEMMRLNTAVPATPQASQNVYGVVAEDLAGFPNGRRPADDVVDLALRVMMGALCHPLPLGAELGVAGAVEDTPSDNVNLGYCEPADAPAGTAAFSDNAGYQPTDLPNAFPYLNTPLPGAS